MCVLITCGRPVAEAAPAENAASFRPVTSLLRAISAFGPILAAACKQSVVVESFAKVRFFRPVGSVL